MATSVEAARQSSRPLKAIGIFGGAFSPFHNGHLRLAIEALERLQLDQVRLVPTAHPMHRAEAAIPAQKRLDWIRLAIEGERRLVADDAAATRAEAKVRATVATIQREARAAEARAAAERDRVAALVQRQTALVSSIDGERAAKAAVLEALGRNAEPALPWEDSEKPLTRVLEGLQGAVESSHHNRTIGELRRATETVRE